MNNPFVLRRAKMSDIDALSQFCQITFRETFVEDLSIPYPEKDLDSYFHSSASPEVFKSKLTDPNQAIWVIEDQTTGEFVAYALVGPCNINDFPHPDVCSNQDGAINRFYVRRGHQNHGFGQQLMNIILPWFDEHYPSRPIWLTICSENAKAQKFYTHYGFSKVGEFDFFVGEWKDLEFMMKRPAKTS